MRLAGEQRSAQVIRGGIPDHDNNSPTLVARVTSSFEEG
jgi:hypothetical protein